MYVYDKLEPADGIKGKTWGPSTLHQRERPYLPALSQASPQNPTHFSKSAPNLDKKCARVAGNDSPTNASSSHSNFLGKSVDGLNIIKSNKNSHSNSTKLGSVDQLNNRYIRHDEQYDDEDDEDGGVKGCFSFISRHEDTLGKRKKHSLDSKMADSTQSPNRININSNAMSPTNALHSAAITLTSIAYAQDVGIDDERHQQKYTPDYDRVFYNKLQKSLDDILSNVYPPLEPLPRQVFDRKQFFVHPNGDDDTESSFDNGNDSSFDAGASTNQDLSQMSMDISLGERFQHESEKSSSQEIFQDDQMHSSSDTASTSRKNSVTFRSDDDSSQLSLFDIPPDRSARITGPYAIITLPPWEQSNTTPKSTTVKKDKSSYFNLNRIFKHKKNSNSDMNEQLLDETQA